MVIACPGSVASVHPACMGGGTRARIAGERLEARPSVTSCAGRGVVWCGVVRCGVVRGYTWLAWGAGRVRASLVSGSGHVSQSPVVRGMVWCGVV